MYNYAHYDIKRRINHLPTPIQRSRLQTWRFFSFNSFITGLLVGSCLAVGLTAAFIHYMNTHPTPAAPVYQPISQPQSPPPVSVIKKDIPKVVVRKPIVWPRELDIIIESGHSLLDLLMNHGIARDEAFKIITSLEKDFSPRDLKIGHHLLMTLEQDKQRTEYGAAVLKTLEIALSPTEILTVSRTSDGYDAQRVKKEVKKVLARTEGTINKHYDGIYKIAKKDRTPDSVINDLIKAYSYDVDFQRDIRQGDHIEILYEKMVTEDNFIVGGGKILHAELSTKGKTIPIYFFSDGESEGFFKENGESIVKKLLRTPVDGARISSGFGMRHHPVLGYSKMHKGVDFAAPTGTPIYAAGDGTIAFAGNKGGYGNFVMIRHNADYATGYGHCSRIASGITSGKKVKQGDIIAYVGSTGRSTGPHLHYEIVQNGDQVNPANVKFAGMDKLSGKRLAKFNDFKRDVASRLAKLAQGSEVQVAQRDKP